jgi:hypothetical protein
MRGSERDGGKRAARYLARRLLYLMATEFPYYSNAQGNTWDTGKGNREYGLHCQRMARNAPGVLW